MRVAIVLLAIAAPGASFAGEGAWVAFFREGNSSVAFERASVADSSVNLLSVAPKKVANGVVYAWEIKTEVYRFDCDGASYRILGRKLFDEKAKMTADETPIVTAMNEAFKDRQHPADTDVLRKAHALVCSKIEPVPAKPFVSMGEAVAWMAN